MVLVLSSAVLGRSLPVNTGITDISVLEMTCKVY